MDEEDAVISDEEFRDRIFNSLNAVYEATEIENIAVSAESDVGPSDRFLSLG